LKKKTDQNSEGRFERREQRSERKPEGRSDGRSSGKKFWKSEEYKQEELLQKQMRKENELKEEKEEEEEDLPMWKKVMLQKAQNPTRWNPLKNIFGSTRDQVVQLRDMKQKDPKLTNHDLATYFGVDVGGVEKILNKDEASKPNGDKWTTAERLRSEVGYISKVNEYFMENPSNPIAYEKLESAARRIITYAHHLGNLNLNPATLAKKMKTWTRKTDTPKEGQKEVLPWQKASNFSTEKPWNEKSKEYGLVKKPWQKDRKMDSESESKPWQNNRKLEGESGSKPWQKGKQKEIEEPVHKSWQEQMKEGSNSKGTDNT